MRNNTVLIVDDEADISLILKLQLEDAGYRTVRAADGVEALECLARQPFDLMLLDIKMPRMNGIQVLERARTEFSDVAVVMMTAHGSESIAVEAMKKGAVDYLAKPFSGEDAVKKVERAISYNRACLENRRLQEDLTREQQKVAAILEGMTDLLVAVDLDGRLMMVNRKVEEALGVQRGDLMARAVEEVLSADLPPEQLPCKVALSTAEPCRDVTYTLTFEGRAVPVMSSAAPLKNSNGRLLGSVEIIRDISRQVALEQEKEDFVSMLSHDLKSPITAIVGSIDLVREGRLGPILADQQEYLDAAVESCDEMTEMIDTLLDVHRFEAGKMTLILRPEGVAAILQKAVSHYELAAGRLQLAIELDLQEGLPPVSIDRAMITRVLENLISNAMKFTGEGGTIGIRAEMAGDIPQLMQRIPSGLYPAETLASQGDYLKISVTDTGIGIPADAVTTIFDRFTQAHNRRLGKTRGTGLGLAFCRKAMDAHNGYIWVESCEGKGSAFNLLIPVSGGE